uniref:Uncharacterized protein n=1 Tax=Elaeophora elaphi TaxID=1147741 RepID=A0A0R3RI58_9BILA
MSLYKLSHIIVIAILCTNLIIVFCGKIPDATVISKRNKRQFYGSHGFGSISVGPYFNYAWGNHHNGWYGPGNYGYGWGMPFGGPFAVRRRFSRRRWQSWGSPASFYGGFDGPWLA